MPKKTPADIELLKKVGKRIKKLRQQSKYANYEVFAYEKNISRSQVYRYEKGTDDLQLTSLIKIIRALEVTPSEFFKDFDSW
jgi:transcriptional regulator with XRE-family HTH domain